MPSYTAVGGVSTLLVEYRGYGRSGGAPSREAVVRDAAAFYDRLARRADVRPDRIMLHGRSIGGAVAAELALAREPAALILESTFTSLESMFWRFGIPGFIVRDRFRTEDALKALDTPVLVMHGRRDNIIPVAHGRELGRIGAKTRYTEYDANHDLPPDWQDFERDLRAFVEPIISGFLPSESAVAVH
ncbi:MAG: alpha/beta fold hydrolase [Pseudomonadota bacterium]|nr:MAG: alpha/beta fold hydrolase [Pseudomonadota bacterium]